MPELPEVECIVRYLKKCLEGKEIREVEFLFYSMLQGIKPQAFREQICGQTIRKVNRKGKYILFFLSNDQILEVHLRMTGRLLYYPNPVTPGKYSGAIFYLDKNAQLHFQDVRKFGTFRVYGGKERLQKSPFLLGPDPLAADFTLGLLDEIMKKKPHSSIKAFLLGQRNIAGMGNIYTDEALFRAGIHPQRKVGSLSKREKKRLFEALGSTLQEGIASGGTSLSDYRDLWGREGEFQRKLKVYRRAGEPCCQCHNEIKRKVVAGRGTYFCPRCQPYS